MPFTDPMADGPSIQAAGLRALKAGMTLKKTLEMVRGFRKDDDTTPLVLMGYYNPIYIYGVDKFLADAKSAGVDGLIIVDLPPEEDAELCLPAMKAGLEFHPAGDADHRRQAAAGGARQHLGLCLLRRDHRHHRQRQRQYRRGRRSRRPHQAAYQIAGLRRLRHPDPGGRARHRAKMPMAPWSAPRWSMPWRPASMPRARRPPKPSPRWPIWWRRWRRACGEPNRPRNKPQLRWR